MELDRPNQDDQKDIDQILAIVAKESAIDRDRLRLDARIDELGIASIDLMETLFALETHFDVEIPMVSSTSGEEFATVGDLVAHTLATIKAAASAKSTRTASLDGASE